jgi:lipopolysaccharide export LptBFGC system permease protein LptF
LFFFLLLSYPFSLGFSRNYKTSGIVISIVVGLTYLIFNSLITTFSMKGFIEPIKSITLSYVVLLAISLVIFYKKTWNRI